MAKPLSRTTIATLLRATWPLPATARLLCLMPLTVIGCRDDPRALEVAAAATSQQAAQNAEMARLNREIAAGHQRQIDAEAQAREQLLAMSREVQSQRSDLDDERRELTDRRREAIAQERRESILGPALYGAAALAASVLPLILCWRLLHDLKGERGDEGDLAELLIMDLAADRPLLLPPTPGSTSSPPVRSPLDEDSPDARLRLDCDDEPPF